MPTDCVKQKIAAYKKKTGRQPNQSIVGQFQTEWYKNANSLKIRQKEMESLRGKPRY